MRRIATLILAITMGVTVMADDIHGEEKLATATLGGGCFWCLEAAFEELAGVAKVVSGYAGGTEEAPSYEAVCRGGTGHAEVVQISYDPAVIGYAELLEVFFTIHDPTTRNRQGADVGTQYRSIILPRDAEQMEIARAAVAALDDSGVHGDRPAVTELETLEQFHPAESYHQDYYRRNGDEGYCQVVISPKMKKFREKFAERLNK
jgi:peptide-methionine (S)-S-oxide reductase